MQLISSALKVLQILHVIQPIVNSSLGQRKLAKLKTSHLNQISHGTLKWLHKCMLCFACDFSSIRNLTCTFGCICQSIYISRNEGWLTFLFSFFLSSFLPLTLTLTHFSGSLFSVDTRAIRSIFIQFFNFFIFQFFFHKALQFHSGVDYNNKIENSWHFVIDLH